MSFISRQVGADIDDASEAQDNTSFNNNFLTVDKRSSTIAPGARRQGGERFTNITIAPGDTIDACTMQVQPFSLSFDDANIDIYMELVLDSPDYSATPDVEGRTRTALSVQWTADALGDGWVTSPELKTVMQEVIDQPGPFVSGNAVSVLSRGRSDASKLFLTKSHDNDPAFAAKLDTTFTSGAAVTGAAVITGVGTLVAVGALILPGIAAFTGVGTVVAVGTIGTIQLGAAVISGAGTLAAVPTMTFAGRAVLEGVGTVVAVGERGVEAAAVLIGVGTMTVIGEITTQLEGRAVIAGVGSMAAVGRRIVTGQAALAGVGALTPAGVITAVGAATIAGVGTVAVIGQTGVILFTIFGIEREIDPADFPTGRQVFFEVHLAAPSGGIAFARLFNVTDAAEVADSQLSTAEVDKTRLRSVALTLPSGAKIYRTEYGGS